MPNITITSEQAAALARGENITVQAEPRDPRIGKTYVVVQPSNGYVWRYKVTEAIKFPRGTLHKGFGVVLAPGNSLAKASTIQFYLDEPRGGGRGDLIITEVTR